MGGEASNAPIRSGSDSSMLSPNRSSSSITCVRSMYYPMAAGTLGGAVHGPVTPLQRKHRRGCPSYETVKFRMASLAMLLCRMVSSLMSFPYTSSWRLCPLRWIAIVILSTSEGSRTPVRFLVQTSVLGPVKVIGWYLFEPTRIPRERKRSEISGLWK